MAASDPTLPPQPELRGIGGLLILVAIGQVLGPVRMLIAFVQYHATTPGEAWTRFPVAMTGELLMTVAVIAIVIWTSFLFFRKSARFPAMFTIEWAAATALFPVNTFWASLATGLPMSTFAGGSDVLEWLLYAVAGFAWVMYVHNSVRVRNTFVE